MLDPLTVYLTIGGVYGGTLCVGIIVRWLMDFGEHDGFSVFLALMSGALAVLIWPIITIVTLGGLACRGLAWAINRLAGK